MLDTIKIIDDINNLGFPVIAIVKHGAQAFFLKGQVVCRMSHIGDTYLIEKTRPDNVLVRCKKCYSLRQAETDTLICEIYWPVDKEEKTVKEIA